MLDGWALELGGLAAGGRVRLTRDELVRRFPLHGQVTRLVCVEGWSAIASWGGIRFADLLAAFPPAPRARWAALRSEVELDRAGRPDPYFISLDLDTARHPQAMLATHHDARPLTLAHGAPLRLVAPMKLGLKNIKAITHIEYVATEPRDYWKRAWVLEVRRDLSAFTQLLINAGLGRERLLPAATARRDPERVAPAQQLPV